MRNDSAAVAQLAEVFPHARVESLQHVLAECGGNLEASVARLLEGTAAPDDERRASATQAGTSSPNPPRPAHGGMIRPQYHNFRQLGGWGSIAGTAAATPVPGAVKYTNSMGGIRLAAEDFPDTLGAVKECEQPVKHSRGDAASWRSAALQPAAQPAGTIMDDSVDTAGLVARFAALNTWAGIDIVEAVLASVGFDEAQAQNALNEMRAGDDDTPDQQQPQAASGSAANTSTSAGFGASSRPASRGASVKPSYSDDVYRRHRAEANKLTHAWRKAVRKVAAAYATGDRSLVSCWQLE